MGRSGLEEKHINPCSIKLRLDDLSPLLEHVLLVSCLLFIVGSSCLLFIVGSQRPDLDWASSGLSTLDSTSGHTLVHTRSHTHIHTSFDLSSYKMPTGNTSSLCNLSVFFCRLYLLCFFFACFFFDFLYFFISLLRSFFILSFLFIFFLPSLSSLSRSIYQPICIHVNQIVYISLKSSYLCVL